MVTGHDACRHSLRRRGSIEELQLTPSHIRYGLEKPAFSQRGNLVKLETMSGFFTAAGNALTSARPDETILADIERVAQLEQPVIRNLWITQHYHSLMGLLSDVLGAGNANWSTFATWASKTAGQSIRGEEVPVEIQQLLIEQAKVQERLSLLLEAMPGNWA